MEASSFGIPETVSPTMSWGRTRNSEWTSDLRRTAVSSHAPNVKKTNITFFATDTGAFVQVLSGQGVAASQDGKLLSLVRDSKLIFLDPVTLVETRSMDAGAPLGSLAVSPDGKLIAVRRRDSAATNVVIIDAEQHREVTVFPTPDKEWAPLLFAREGTLLLTAGQTANTISAWDTRSWRKVAAFEGIEWIESRSMAAIAVSPDGKTIAAGGKAGLVLVWDVDRPSNPTVFNTGAGPFNYPQVFGRKISWRIKCTNKDSCGECLGCKPRNPYRRLRWKQPSAPGLIRKWEAATLAMCGWPRDSESCWE